MKVLVIGGGGREHAIVDALSRSPQVEKIFCAPGNAGITAQAECVAIRETEVERLRDFAAQNGIGLTVVGPEVALAAGVVDVFKAAGLRAEIDLRSEKIQSHTSYFICQRGKRQLVKATNLFCYTERIPLYIVSNFKKYENKHKI